MRWEMDFKKVFNILKKEQPKPVRKKNAASTYQRAFKAAMNSRFIDWLFTSGHKVNNDLISQLKVLIERSRDLSKNNQLFRAYLNNCIKGVVGAEGFRLQMQIKNADGTLNEELNDQIEWAWYDFTNKKRLQTSEKLRDVDFDTLLYRTLLVDGEAFIQVIKDNDSPYGVKFRLIDSLAVDTNYLQIMTETQNGIYNGVEVDHDYRVVRYWLRQCYNGNYQSGRLYALPAEEVIHLYRPEFIDQVRGYSPIVASYDSLKQLDDFAVAELIAAKIASCQGIFYERSGNGQKGDFLSEGETIDEGTFLRELAPGMASVVPEGYSVKTMTPNHPSNNYDGFVKAITKRVASAMGTNYNSMNGDLQSVNYSSLRQANIAEYAFFKEWQRFLIQNWKNIQFELFLKGYLINSKTELKPSLFNKYLRSYRFIPKTDPSYDIAKEAVAVERMLKLGLTSHIIQIEKRGLDPQELVKDEVKWRELCDKNGLPYNFYETSTVASLDAVNQFNDESNGTDENDK